MPSQMEYEGGIMLVFIQKYIGLFIYPTVAVVLSAFFTYLCIRLLPRLGYLDKPGGRHIHNRLVPRGGGIAIILAFFLSLAFYVLESRSGAGGGEVFWRLLLPAIPLGGLGLIDDRWELKSWVKLLVQLGVVLVVWWTGPEDYVFFGHVLPWFISLPLTAGWVIIIINAFNLIDGLDGLAAGLAVVSSGCMVIWFLMAGRHAPEAVAMMILAGACLGFLRYNFYPAKIFLGDTGSTFLGLIFAIIGLSAIDRAVTITSLLLPVLAIGVPIFDVVLAIWRRSTRKLLDPNAGGIMDGDQDHLHHRMLRVTKKQTTTAWRMYMLASFFAVVALLVILVRDSAPAVAYIILLLAVLIALRQLAVVELFDSAQLIRNGLAKPKRGILVNMVHPFIDFGLIGLAYMIAASLALGSFHYFNVFVLAFAPPVLLLCFSGVYRVYWLRAGLNNYWHLASMVLLGTLVSNSLIMLFCFPEMDQMTPDAMQRLFAGSLLFSLLATTLISLERFLLHYAEGFWFRKLSLQYQAPEKLQRTAIFGGGLNCRLFINSLYCCTRSECREKIVGIIDDDSALHGLRVYGFKVLGGAEDIEEIYRRQPFSKLVVTAGNTPVDSLHRLEFFCRAHNIRFSVFRICETTLPQFPVNDSEELESDEGASDS